MDDNDLIAQRIVQSLSFEVETVLHKNVALESNSKTTPLNVKIKVRKKEDTAIEHGILTVTRAKAKNNVPEKIRLVNSDQTIISFDVTMDANFDKKPTKKHRKRFFGIFKPGTCLSTQVNDDDYPYLPPSSYNSNPPEDSISTKSDGILKLHFPLSKRNNEFATPSSYSNKRKIFLGKCKPGGCLDPPFGEDSFTYSPANQTKSISEQNVIKMKPVKIKNYRRNSKYSSSSVVAADNTFLSENMISLDNSSNVQVMTKPEIDKKSILNIYQAESINTSLSTTHSNSIITYPPTLTSSDVHSYNEKNTKNRHFSPENKPKKSFDEYSNSYFILPKKKSNQPTQKTMNKNDLNLLVTNFDNKFTDGIRITNTEENNEDSRLCSMPTSFDNKDNEIGIIKETGKLAAVINIDPHITLPVDVLRDNKDSEARIDKEEKRSLSNKNSLQLLSYIGTKLTTLEPFTPKSDILSQNSNEPFQNKFEELNFTQRIEETIYEKHPKPTYQHVNETSKRSQISVVYKQEDSTFNNSTYLRSGSGLPSGVEISSLSNISDCARDPSKQSNLDSFKEINDTIEVLRKGDELTNIDYQPEDDNYEQPECAQFSPKIHIYKKDIETRNDKNEKNIYDKSIKNVDCKLPIQSKNNSFNHSPEPDIISTDIKIETSFEPSFQLEKNLSYESLKIKVSSTSKDKGNRNMCFGSEATQQLPPKIENNLFLQSLESDLEQMIEFKDMRTSNIDLQLEKNQSIGSTVCRADTLSGKVRNLYETNSAGGILILDSPIRVENNMLKQNLKSNFDPTKDYKDDHNSMPFPRLANKPSTQSLKFKTGSMSNKEETAYIKELISEGLTHCSAIENVDYNHSSKSSFIAENDKNKLMVIPDVLHSDYKFTKESIELKIIPSDTKAEKSYIIRSSSDVSQKYNIIIEKRNGSILSAIMTSEAEVNNSIKESLHTNAEVYPTLKLDEHEQTIPKVDDQYKTASETSTDLINSEYAVERNFTDEDVNREQLKNNNNNNDNILNNIANEFDLPRRIFKLSDGLLKTEETPKNIYEHISLHKILREESIVKINALLEATPEITNSFEDPAVILPQSQDNICDIPSLDGTLSIQQPTIDENFETLSVPSSNIIIDNYKTNSPRQSFQQKNMKQVSENDLEESIYSPNNLPFTTFSIENLIPKLQNEDTERIASLIVSDIDDTNVSVGKIQMIEKSNRSVNLSVLLIPETSEQEDRNLVHDKSSDIMGIKFKHGVELPKKKTVERSDIMVIKHINLLKNAHISSVTEKLDINSQISNVEEKNDSVTSYNSNKTTAQHTYLQPYIGSIKLKGTQPLDETNNTNKNPVKDLSPKKMFGQNEAKAPDLYKELPVEDLIKLRNAYDGIASSPASQSMALTTSTIRSTQKRDEISIDFAFQSYANDNHERVLKTYDSAKEPERYMNDTLVIVKSQIKLSHEMRIPVGTETDIFIQIGKMTMEEETVGKSKTSLEHSKANLMEESVEADNKEVVKPKTHNAEVKTYNEILDDKLQASLALVYEQDLVPLQNIIKDLKEEIYVLAEHQVSFRDHLFNKKTKSTRLINPNKRCGCLRKYL